jgi:hypothetical protein
MARTGRTRADNQAIREWLAKGNKVTKCEPGAKSEPGEVTYTWGRKPKKKADPKEKKPTKKG